MTSSKYREQPTLDSMIKALKEQVRDLASQSRIAVTTAVVTATQRLVVAGGLIRVQTAFEPDTSSAVVFDASITSRARVDLTFPGVASSISNPTEGQELTITWVQASVSVNTYTWPLNCRFAGGIAPTDTTPGSWTSVTFIYKDPDWWEISRAVGVV